MAAAGRSASKPFAALPDHTSRADFLEGGGVRDSWLEYTKRALEHGSAGLKSA
jgi:hypothetical protein